MGWFGLMWLKEEVAKLKALRGIIKDEEQLKMLDEVIANLEKKAK